MLEFPILMKRFVALSEIFGSARSQRRIPAGLLQSRDLYWLEQAVNILNSTAHTDIRDELRKLVDTWLKSGPNLKKMIDADPELRKLKVGRARLIPTRTGRGLLDWQPITTGENCPREPALNLFFHVVVDPEWERLAGPCPRCKKYFLKKVLRQKIYCSRTCGNYITALAATRKKRREKKKAELKIAQKIVNDWASSKRNGDWESKVEKRIDKTRKWITRAINSGALRVPKSPA
jgi:hypothetical protein